MGCLTFEMLDGANSQLYIYINQIQALKNILNAPYRYQNRLLEMLTYLYEGEFSNEQMWNLVEDYFLGRVPEKVMRDCKKERPEMRIQDYGSD